MGQESTMSDTKGGFAKTVQKHAGRAKEKILQNLGKADKTTDEVFDDYEVNFNKQQSFANRLHREIANYLKCCRALHGASKALFDTLSEVYEPEWVGHDLLYVQSQNSDMLWTDFCHKLQDQTLAPLTAYSQLFPDLRKKIDKRGRKLVDYDSQRHQLENLQRSNRRDDYKVARAKDQLETARQTFDMLNKELYEELPSIYDQRIPSVAESLQSLFAAEATFMKESCKISQEMEAIAEKLHKECNKGTYAVKRGSPVAPLPIQVSNAVNSPGEQLEIESEHPAFEESSCKLYPVLNDSPTQSPPSPTSPPPDHLNEDSQSEEKDEESPNRPVVSGPVTSNKEETGRPYEEIAFEDKNVNGTANGEVLGTKIPPGRQVSKAALCSSAKEESKEVLGFKGSLNGPTYTAPLTENNKCVEDLYDIPLGATTEGLPPGILYRVKATYKYNREDVDELNFEVNEIIQVMEYDDPEEQEEGWLCGIKESTNEKGLFPANFTRPI